MLLEASKVTKRPLDAPYKLIRLARISPRRDGIPSQISSALHREEQGNAACGAMPRPWRRGNGDRADVTLAPGKTTIKGKDEHMVDWHDERTDRRALRDRQH
jgi:hypothetical protein